MRTTDKVIDTNIIKLAKEQYEQKKISNIPGMVVNLPSTGEIYDSNNPLSTGQVEMRYMTAYDEDILTNSSYIKEGIVLDKLITALVITPGFDIKTVGEADKEWMIISARIAGFGSEYPVTVKAPNGKEISENINLSKLKPLPFNLTSDDKGEFEYSVSDKTKIKFQFPLASIFNNLPEDHAISYLLKHVIKQINNVRDDNRILEFIKYEFTAPESREFRKYLNTNSPGIDMTYEFSYTDEGGKTSTFRAGFPIGTDFFWL